MIDVCNCNRRLHATNCLKLYICLILGKLYRIERDTLSGPSIACVVKDHIETMKKLLSEHVTTEIMLDVEGKVSLV